MRSILFHGKAFYWFFRTILSQGFIVKELVKRDMQKKYFASFIGIWWAFIQPAALIFVMWFAFTFGLKIGDVDDRYPFALWLICGMIPWFFISETLQSASNSLVEYSYLIKKTSFKTGFVPMIKLLTALIVHVFFVLFMLVVASLYGYYPDLYWIQIIYYLFSAIVLLCGFAWLGAALNVFVRDVGPVISVITSVMFWVTPIIWPFTMLEGRLQLIAYLNPFFYLTEGYRNVFLHKVWFFETPLFTFYFWLFTFLVFSSGAIIFRKLKPHFADVL